MEKQNKKIMKIEINPKNVNIEGLGTDETNEYKVIKFSMELYFSARKNSSQIFMEYEIRSPLIIFESNGVSTMRYIFRTGEFKALDVLPIPFNLEQNEYSINLQDQTITLIER